MRARFLHAKLKKCARMLFAVAKNGVAPQKRAFWSVFTRFSNAGNLASHPLLLLKEVRAGLGLEDLTPSAGVSDRPISAVTGAWRRLEFFLSSVSNEIEAEFNTRT
jgi:hypothetical protein